MIFQCKENEELNIPFCYMAKWDILFIYHLKEI